jgi:hypothetical protein
MVTAVCPLLRLDRLLTAGDMKSSLAGFDVYPPAVGCQKSAWSVSCSND